VSNDSQPNKKLKMKRNVSNLQISGNLMKILSLVVMLAFVAPLMINAQAGKANFAGSWKYNAEKSNVGQAAGQGQGGGMRMGGGGDFVAKQEANLLTVTRTMVRQDGTSNTTETKYTLDGKVTVTTTQRGDSKSTATWSADGKSLTVVTTMTMNDMEMKTTAVWTLTDASTLTITTTRPGRDGVETKTTAVYNKN
jgi:hypothetical protein